MDVFDQRAKHLAVRGLSCCVEIFTEVEVGVDKHRVDIRLRPRPGSDPQSRLARVAPLGLFGQFVERACTLEVFRKTPSKDTVLLCLEKHLRLRRNLAQAEPDGEPPELWIVSSGRPDACLEGGLFVPDAARGPGFYVTCSAMLTAHLIVVRELPVTRHTLLDLALTVKKTPEKRSDSDMEFANYTSPELQQALDEVRAELRQEGREQGLQQGLEQGLTAAFLRIFQRRFGPAPEAVTNRLRETHDTTLLEQWIDLAATSSRGEVLAALAQ